MVIFKFTFTQRDPYHPAADRWGGPICASCGPTHSHNVCNQVRNMRTFCATLREALIRARDPHHDRIAQNAAQFRAYRKADAPETPRITSRLKSSSSQWHRTAPQQCNERERDSRATQKRVALPLCTSPHARLHTVRTSNSQWRPSILRTRSARPRARR